MKRRGECFLLVGRHDFDGPADIYAPTDGYRSLKLSSFYWSSLSYHNPHQPITPSLSTHAASSAIPYKQNLIVTIAP